MFHDSHHLDGIVALLNDAWQNVFGKVAVVADLVVLGGDAHVTLVDLE